MDPHDGERPVILVVEDEALTIMDLGDCLEDHGYDTIQCASGERAFSILQDHPEICGLVVDVQLTGTTDGFDVATYVAKTHPGMPILIISGRASPDPQRMPPGALFLARPCTNDDILTRLKFLMSKR